MEKNTIAEIVLALACLGMLTVCGCIGNDNGSYKEGYIAGMEGPGNVSKTVGLMNSQLALIRSLNRDSGNTYMTMFSYGILKELTPAYNKQVKAYNTEIETVNLEIKEALGDEAGEYLFEEREYYY